jgi:predicted PurR-regulated permease PerM
MSKLSIGTIFPAKNDPRHPPQWFLRALVWVTIAVYAAIFVYNAFFMLADVIAVVIISFFLSLALEPVVDFLNNRGMPRSVATLICIFSLFSAVVAAIIFFGNIFVSQILNLVRSVPDLYKSFAVWLDDQLNMQIPEAPEAAKQFAQQYGETFGGQFFGTALSTAVGVLTAVLNVLTIMLVMYYLCSKGNEFRASLASWFPPEYQKRLIRVLTIVQVKIGGFLGSRLILALISTVFISALCFFMGVPYWLALGVFMGIVSQLIPTVGVYIGGALPVLVAFSQNGWMLGTILLVVIIVYQNIENMLIMPKISQEALDLNPAIAFLSVLGFGFLFGPLGAFLALPVTATFVTVVKLWWGKYDIIDIEEVAREQRSVLRAQKEHQKIQESKQKSIVVPKRALKGTEAKKEK